MPFTTLNPSDKETNITLSGGNLIATGTNSGYHGVRATTSRIVASGGSYYYEVTLTTHASLAYNSAGFGLSGDVLNNVIGTGGTAGYLVSSDSYYPYDKFSRDNNAQVVDPSWSVAVQGDVLGFGLNLGTKVLTIYKNGVVSSTQLAALSAVGPFFPMLVVKDSSVLTANFGATAFHSGLPGGYLAWNYNPPPANRSNSTVASPRPIRFIGL